MPCSCRSPPPPPPRDPRARSPARPAAHRRAELWPGRGGQGPRIRQRPGAAGSRGTLKRFALFSVVGTVVFIAGTALQWVLLRRWSVASDWSYVLQTLFSIELAYALNKAITWPDRTVPLLRSLARWNLQRIVLAVPNVLLYDWLQYRTGSWMAANVIATAAFIIINYLAANFWAFAAARSAGRRLSLTGTTVAAVLVALPVAIVIMPEARILVYGAWMLPAAELAMLAAGSAYFRRRFREAMPGVFSELIIQITTAGREPGRVSEIIAQIRGYDLLMPHQVWVVTDPATIPPTGPTGSIRCRRYSRPRPAGRRAHLSTRGSSACAWGWTGPT